MKAGDSPTLRDQARGAIRWLLVMICALGFTAAMVSVILAPLVLGRLYTSDEDYSRVSDIGQSYGAASAVISTMALGVVLVGLIMQHRQFKSGRLKTLSDMTEELVRLAMDEPVYRQCWGARTAPETIDEDIFYYCNRVLKSWKRAWELRDLPEAQARSYLANFFDSEIPRLFWQIHGDWHMQGKARNRRERFLAMTNEEYLRAVKGGPPSRRREQRQPSRSAAKSRRQHLLETDRVNGQRMVP